MSNWHPAKTLKIVKRKSVTKSAAQATKTKYHRQFWRLEF
jgi:hypothetical protein